MSHLKQKPANFGLLFFVMFISLGLQLSGCASDSYTSKGAKQGAVQGAAAGAVGGLVSALVFGGDPLDRAARGAVYGGAAGAVAGGISGNRVDKQVQSQKQAQANLQAQTQTQQQQHTELKALKKEIGKAAFKGLAALAECQHDVTLKKARKAQKQKNPNHRLAGLWLEVLSYADSRQEERVRNLLPIIVTQDRDIKTEAQAEQVVLEAVGELAIIRREYNLPLVCSA